MPGLLDMFSNPQFLNASMGLLAAGGPHTQGQNRMQTFLNAYGQGSAITAQQERTKLAKEIGEIRKQEADARQAETKRVNAQREGMASALAPGLWKNPDTGEGQRYGGLLGQLDPETRGLLSAMPPETALSLMAKQKFTPRETFSTQTDAQGNPVSQTSSTTGKVSTHPLAPPKAAATPAEQRLYEWGYGDKAREMWARDQAAEANKDTKITPSQSANNDEITAARSYLMGQFPGGMNADLLETITSAEVRGRANPDYNPLFEQAFRRANQKQVGGDATWDIWQDWAGFKGGRTTAPPDVQGGGVVPSAAAAEVPIPDVIPSYEPSPPASALPPSTVNQRGQRVGGSGNQRAQAEAVREQFRSGAITREEARRRLNELGFNGQ